MLIGPLGFAARSLRRRGFHSYLAFLGLTLTIATTTFLLLLGQDLASRLGVDSSMRSTFGISWLIFAYLVLSLPGEKSRRAGAVRCVGVPADGRQSSADAADLAR